MAAIYPVDVIFNIQQRLKGLFMDDFDTKLKQNLLKTMLMWPFIG